MADKTIVVEIEYDTKAAIKSVNELSRAVEGERVEQAKLKKELEEGTISQVEYSKELANSKEAANKANAERRNTIKLLSSEKGSVNELKANIKKLTQERDKLNQNTKEGRDLAGKYNDRIDEMKTTLKETQQQTGKTQGAISKLGGDLMALPGPIGGVIQGMVGMTKAALKFIATPIGAILTAIVLVFKLLQKAFMRNEKSMNKLRALTSRVSGVFNGLLKILEPVVDFIFNQVVKAFDALASAADKAINLVSKGLRKLGFDKAADNVDKYTEALKQASVEAERLANETAKLVEMQRFAEKTQLDFQKAAEKLRQIRDDESKSIDERIKANEKLGTVLKKQLNEELKIAAHALKVANLRIKVEGESTANLDARAEALTRISDIQERVSGQESEQLVNINSLLRERDALEKERLKNNDQFEQDFEELLETKELDAELDEEIAQQEMETDNMVTENALANAEARIAAREEERIINQLILDEALAGMQDIISASAGMANKRVTIASDAFAKLSTINFKEIKSAKDGFLAIAEGAKGLTGLITAGHERELQDFEKSERAKVESHGEGTHAREVAEKQYQRKLVKLKKKQFEDEKKKAILDATIAGAIAVVKGLAAGLPLPGLALAALAGILTGVQVASIKRQPTPSFTSDQVFAKGGVIGGLSHSQGGTQFVGSDGSRFEAERGEAMFVLKKDATAEIAALSAINEGFGGRSFFKGSKSHLQEGGEASGASNIEQTVDEAISRTPIIVRVADIETGMTDVNNTKEAGVI